MYYIWSLGRTVIIVRLEGVEWPSVFFEAPQLDTPVDGGGEEEVAEVHVAAVGVVSRNTRDGGTVALKRVQNTCKTRVKGEK